MSGPSHFVFGFGLGLLFYFLTEKKFSARHVLVFGVNNWYGPDFGVILCRVLEACGVDSDLAWTLGIETIHSYLLWPLFALLLTWPWYSWLKTDLNIPQRGQNLWTKQERSPISFVQIFKLVVAGGYLHFFVDDTFPLHFFYQETIDLGVWHGASIHWSMALTGFISFFYVFFTIWFLHSAYWSPRKQWRNLFSMYLLYVGANTALFTFYYLTTGLTMAVGDEIDYGLNIWLLLMFFAPLFMAASTVPLSTNKDSPVVPLSDSKSTMSKPTDIDHTFLQENRFIVLLFVVVLLTYVGFYFLGPDLIEHLI